MIERHPNPMSAYAYSRYLSAKRTVDDRALNRLVLAWLQAELSRSDAVPLRVLEIGAGLGTMVARLIEWKILSRANYLAVDADPGIVASSREWLRGWADARGYLTTLGQDELRILGQEIEFNVRFIPLDVNTFLQSADSAACADLLIANAVLDLVELPGTLRHLLPALTPAGVYWFSVNYDGETSFLPEHASDAQFISVYNRSMDQRVRHGRPAGDSKTGRRLFQHLRSVHAPIAAAGASDWVVYAADERYPADEAYFLHHIIHTVDEELQQHAEIPRDALAEWVKLRHAQIDRGELVYIAHQLDFAGRARRVRL